MVLEKACIKDLSLLARFHQQLMEDEKHDNQIGIDDAEKGMKKYLTSTDTAYFFKIDNIIIGYALIDNSKSPIYLRHFFISRDKRKKGYGTKAFKLLESELCFDKIDLDVFTWNSIGIKFWESLGFKNRCYIKRYTNRK